MDKQIRPITHTAVGRIEVDGVTYQNGEGVALSPAAAASLEERGAVQAVPAPEPTPAAKPAAEAPAKAAKA